jgi:hypothetical protein
MMAVYESSSPVGVKIPQSEDSTSHTDESINGLNVTGRDYWINEVRKIEGKE